MSLNNFKIILASINLRGENSTSKIHLRLSFDEVLSEFRVFVGDLNFLCFFINQNLL